MFKQVLFIKLMEVERRHLPDEKLEAMLNRLKKEVPNLVCSSGNKITRLCNNPKCKRAARCNSLNCNDCGKKVHLGCGYILLDELTEMLNDRTEVSREFILNIFRIEQEFIENIRKIQMEFIDHYGLGNMDDRHRKLVRALYENKGDDFKLISGKQAMQVCDSLRIEGQDNQKRDQKRLESYSEYLQKLINQLESQKKYCLSRQLIEIDSAVLRSKGTLTKDTNFIMDSLNNPRQLKLLFRASQHNFRAEDFHAKCDNFNDTLILVRTEFGKTIAGYTHYKWNHTGGDINDPGKKAFLLQLDLQEKYVPQEDNYLIYADNSYGPIFGKGNRDIYLPNNCQNNPAHGRFPSGYNTKDKKYTDRQQSYTMFTGATNGFQFKVLEYEVFHVIYC